MKLVGPFDCTRNPALNFVFASGTAAPASPVMGQVWVDTTDSVNPLVRIYLGATEGWSSFADAAGGGLTNPMTVAGDMILGTSGGTPVRLPKGVDGQVLAMVAGLPSWTNAATAGGMSNPMTSAWDLVVGGTAGAPERLAVGTPGQVPTVQNDGSIAWATPQGGGGGASLTITAPAEIVIPNPFPTFGADPRVPIWDQTHSGECSPDYRWAANPGDPLSGTDPDTDLTEPPERLAQWHTASADDIAGATYQWVVEGAWISPNGTRYVQGENTRTVKFVAQVYTSIELKLTVTLPSGQQMTAKKVIPVKRDHLYYPDLYVTMKGSEQIRNFWVLMDGTTVGFIAPSTSKYLMKIVGDTRENFSQSAFPMMSGDNARPQVYQLPNGEIDIFYGTGPNSWNRTGWGHTKVSAAGETLREFASLVGPDGKDWRFTSALDGSIYGIQYEDNAPQSTKLYRYTQSNGEASFTIADTAYRTITMDPEQPHLVYSFDNLNRTLVSINFSTGSPVVTPLPGFVPPSNVDSYISEEVHDQMQADGVALGAGGNVGSRVNALHFRKEDGIRYVYFDTDSALCRYDIDSPRFTVIAKMNQAGPWALPPSSPRLYAKAAWKGISNPTYGGGGAVLEFKTRQVTAPTLEAFPLFDNDTWNYGYQSTDIQVYRLGRVVWLKQFGVQVEKGDYVEADLVGNILNSDGWECHPRFFIDQMVNCSRYLEGAEDWACFMFQAGQSGKIILRWPSYKKQARHNVQVHVARPSAMADLEAPYGGGNNSGSNYKVDAKGHLVEVRGDYWVSQYTYTSTGAPISKTMTVRSRNYNGSFQTILKNPDVYYGVKFNFYFNPEFEIGRQPPYGGGV